LITTSAEGGRDTTALVGRGVRLSVEAGPPPLGKTDTIDVVVEGGVDPSAKRLFARKGGAQNDREIGLTEQSTGPLRLRGEVPADLVTRRGIDYYAELVGRQADTLRVPPEGRAHLPVRFDSVRAPVRMRPERYRMVTVPVRPEGGTKAALREAYGSYDPSRWRLLRWDAGAESYVEYPNLDSLEAGEAFWLITSGGTAPTGGSGRTAEAGTKREIPLEAGWNQVGSPFGYAVPWPAVLAASGLEEASVDGPVGYDSTGYRPKRTKLRPWRGYFVFSAEADTLVVPPRGAGGSTSKDRDAKEGRPVALAQSRLWTGGAPEAPSAEGSEGDGSEAKDADDSEETSGQPPTKESSAEEPAAEEPTAGEKGAGGEAPMGGGVAEGGSRQGGGVSQTSAEATAQAREKLAAREAERPPHTLRVEAWPQGGQEAKTRRANGRQATGRQATGRQASRVWLGLREGAKRGRDRLDFAKAPPIGRGPRLSVIEEVAGREVPHAGSFKPKAGRGRSWQLRLTNRSEGSREVRLGLEGEGRLPSGFERYVLDLRKRRRVAPGQTVRLEAEESRALKVIVGTEGFAEQKSEGIGLEVFKNELRGNYPNPFGEETTLAYTLKGKRAVTIEIYDVLGRRVRTLLKEKEQEAGLHRLQWEGENRYGTPVGSGVYFYRIEAGDFRETRKMVVVR
jgi:hypothetical protein